jgi:toxin ParE1/3/4
LRLGAHAESDFQEIVVWTGEHFGVVQARLYRQTILATLEELQRGPEQAGVRKRDEIAPGLRTIHVARRGRRGRHFILFRVADRTDEKIIEVLRILHDAMDFARHLPAKNAGDTP